MSKTFSYGFCQNVGSIVNANRNGTFKPNNNAYPSKQEDYAALSQDVSCLPFPPMTSKVVDYQITSHLLTYLLMILSYAHTHTGRCCHIFYTTCLEWR